MEIDTIVPMSDQIFSLSLQKTNHNMGEHICFRRNNRLKTINPYWKGNPSVKGKFFNREHRYRPGMKSFLKWRFSKNPQGWEKKHEIWNPPVKFIHSLDDIKGDVLIWLGHNSFFLQLAGKRIMFDPVFGNIPFMKRKSTFPADPNAFKNINYLLISHDHYDHLDKASVKLLMKNNPGMKLFCGIGTGELISRWGHIEVCEAGWYQQLQDGDLTLTFLPAQHWSKRFINDGGKRLWGAFMLQGDGLSLYYSGDTGYASHFKEVPALMGQVDYFLVGIGAYKPKWFMRPNHISPSEALDAAEDIQAKVTIPMHYGTFDLSSEPLNDPPKVFAEEARKRHIHIRIPKLGEIVRLWKIK